jgi:hypothetical protein
MGLFISATGKESTMWISEKAKKALQSVVEQLQSGDFSPLVTVLRIQRAGIPPDR